ncbi:MAG: DUF2069 domain-containing protein [Burkholderiaceae bacterium]
MSSTRRIVIASFIALIVLGLAWELWLAPLRPSGSLLALKVVPLALALPSLLRGTLRTYQWWSMLILLYAAEGLLRATSDRGPGVALGAIEAALAGLAFGAILLHVRSRIGPRPARRR